MEFYQEVERSIITKYRKRIWANFVKAIKDYNLIEKGDKIACCISGGKDSFLMAKLFQEIQKHGDFYFDVEYIVMDPGYKKENRELIEENARKLNIPIKILESDIFECVDRMGGAPCYMCARMRRGFLYAKAKELGCNKIALGHHFNDVIETLLMSMFYGCEIKYILIWKNAFDLKFLQCACKLTEGVADGHMDSKRSEIKKLIEELKKTNKDIDINLFSSLHNVNLDAINGYRENKTYHDFNEIFEKMKNEK